MGAVMSEATKISVPGNGQDGDGQGSNRRDGAGTAPLVLELRVHGVNNTTPDALVDLPPYDLRQVGGDKRASFWRAQPDTPRRPGRRGYILPGIRREAYSWGGLVRDDPGTQKWYVAVALAFQVLALPFSLGNAAMWTRRLTKDDVSGGNRVWAGITAGAARLFGLVLTLLFTTTAVTLAVDLAALQCADGMRCTGPWVGAWGWVTNIIPAEFLTPDRVLAVAAFVPVLWVGLLAWFAGLARRRYDTLHVKPGTMGEAARDAIAESKKKDPASAANKEGAVLAQPAFWSNRVTGRLGLVHLAAAIALTVFQVGLHATILAAQSGDASAADWRFVTGVAGYVLLGSVVAVLVLPTQTITPRGEAGGGWTAVLSWALLAHAVIAFGVLFGMLWFSSADVATSPAGLLAADWPPVVLVALGTVLALTGTFWRRKKERSGTGWLGCAPAVFMSVSLGLALLTGSAVIAFASVLAGGWSGPGLLFEGIDRVDGLSVPPIFLAVGSMLFLALVLLLVGLALFLIPKKVLADRLKVWMPSPVDPEHPDSQKIIKGVEKRRRLAALVHLVEPAAGMIAILMGGAVVAGLIWTFVAAMLGLSLVGNVNWLASLLGVSIGVLAVLGAALAAAVAVFGIWVPRPGLVAVVWDITCFMPRTAQPFGPPCYAERAVPDVAQRLCDWLSESPNHRAILSAHSMGAMLAVGALGLLGATSPDLLPRVSLLTFGVQLRVFFGRFFPELVGPKVLGTLPARPPRPWRRDPWAKDATADDRVWLPPPNGEPIRRLSGTLLSGHNVRWINLWRLTDYLGFPVASGIPARAEGDAPWTNEIDVYASEVDRTVQPPLPVMHNDYFRVETYEAELRKLAGIQSG